MKLLTSENRIFEMSIQKPQSCEKGHVERGNVPISQVEEVKTAFFCSDQMYGLNRCGQKGTQTSARKFNFNPTG